MVVSDAGAPDILLELEIEVLQRLLLAFYDILHNFHELLLAYILLVFGAEQAFTFWIAKDKSDELVFKVD